MIQRRSIVATNLNEIEGDSRGSTSSPLASTCWVPTSLLARLGLKGLGLNLYLVETM